MQSAPADAPQQRSRLAFRDESYLAWYFDRGLPEFVRSTFGPMVDRAMQYGFVRRGGATIPLDKAYPEAKPPRVVDHELVYDERELTAQPTAEYENFTREEPTVLSASKMAYVTRRLDRLRPEYKAVFEAFFGADGGRCAAPGKVEHESATREGDKEVKETRRWSGFGLEKLGGRLVALYPLTETGRRMVRASETETQKHGVELHLSPLERMAVIVVQAHKERIGQPNRWEKVMRVQREADALWAEACTAWNQASQHIFKVQGRDDGDMRGVR